MASKIRYSESVNFGGGISLLQVCEITGETEEECFQRIWDMEYRCIPWHFIHGMDYSVEGEQKQRYLNWKKANKCFGKCEECERYKKDMNDEMRRLYPYLYMKKG